jgi:hypothetical protein
MRHVLYFANTAHLKAPMRQHTLDDQPILLNNERLQEENIAQFTSNAHRVHSAYRTRHLEISGARKDDPTLHDVVRDECVHHSRGRRKKLGTVLAWQTALSKRMRRIAAQQGNPPVHKYRRYRMHALFGREA